LNEPEQNDPNFITAARSSLTNQIIFVYYLLFFHSVDHTVDTVLESEEETAASDQLGAAIGYAGKNYKKYVKTY